MKTNSFLSTFLSSRFAGKLLAGETLMAAVTGTPETEFVVLIEVGFCSPEVEKDTGRDEMFKNGVVEGCNAQNAVVPLKGMAHTGTKVCGCPAVVIRGASTVAPPPEIAGESLFRFMSKSEGSFRFLSVEVTAAELTAAVVVVGILRVPLTDVAMAGMVPVPVAAIMEGSACCKSHWIVSPSDL